jgi:hypothetical protein
MENNTRHPHVRKRSAFVGMKRPIDFQNVAQMAPSLSLSAHHGAIESMSRRGLFFTFWAWMGWGGPGLSWLFNRVQQRIRHHSRRQVAVS